MTDMNGTPVVLAGVAAEDELLPILGAARARIAYPLLGCVPIYSGRWARAWTCDLAAIRRWTPIGQPPDAVVGHWIVEAPWSSQVVHSYSLLLIHLRPVLGRAPARHFLERSTHEMALWAINPQADRARMLTHPVGRTDWLHPAVFAAQLIAEDDAKARERVLRAVELIGDGRLSPHPAHARSWIELFGDNMFRLASRPTESEAK